MRSSRRIRLSLAAYGLLNVGCALATHAESAALRWGLRSLFALEGAGWCAIAWRGLPAYAAVVDQAVDPWKALVWMLNAVFFHLAFEVFFSPDFRPQLDYVELTPLLSVALAAALTPLLVLCLEHTASLWRAAHSETVAPQLSFHARICLLSYAPLALHTLADTTWTYDDKAQPAWRATLTVVALMAAALVCECAHAARRLRCSFANLNCAVFGLLFAARLVLLHAL
jgi:hypothetical protein